MNKDSLGTISRDLLSIAQVWVRDFRRNEYSTLQYAHMQDFRLI